MAKNIAQEIYRGPHKIVEPVTTADNLLAAAPDDLWEHIGQYHDLNDAPTKESYRILKPIQGQPDQELTIYRSVPKGVKKINEGDWVTLSRTYAIEHGMHPTDSKKDLPVISMKVKAREIGWDGNDLNEFAYYPSGKAKGRFNPKDFKITRKIITDNFYENDDNVADCNNILDIVIRKKEIKELSKNFVASGSFTYNKRGKLITLVVNVIPEFRRKGIATYLYDQAEEYFGSKLIPSGFFEGDEIERFWENRKKGELYAKGGKVKKTKLGDCYVVAGKEALSFLKDHSRGFNYNGEPYVVHAEVGPEDFRHGHAWLEDDRLVYDFSNGNSIIIPKDLYYQLGNIKTDDPKKYRRYTFDEARDKMDETGYYGHWDLETLETGGEIKGDKAQSLAQVNRAIHKKFPTVNLTKGHHYYYISSEDDEMALTISGLYTSSIYVNSIKDQSVERWVMDVETLLKNKVTPVGESELGDGGHIRHEKSEIKNEFSELHELHEIHAHKLHEKGGQIPFEDFSKQLDQPKPEVIDDMEFAIQKLKAKYDKVSGSKTYLDQVGASFHGGMVGFKGGRQAEKYNRAIEKSIDNAVTANKISKEIENLERRLKLYRAGKVNEHGQPKVQTIEKLTALVARSEEVVTTGELKDGQKLDARQISDLKDQLKHWKKQLNDKLKKHKAEYQNYLEKETIMNTNTITPPVVCVECLEEFEPVNGYVCPCGFDNSSYYADENNNENTGENDVKYAQFSLWHLKPEVAEAYDFADFSEAANHIRERNPDNHIGGGLMQIRDYEGRLLLDHDDIMKHIDMPDFVVNMYEGGGQTKELYEVEDYLKEQKTAADEMLFSRRTRLAKYMICNAYIRNAEARMEETENGMEKNAWAEVKNIWTGAKAEVTEMTFMYEEGGETGGCGCTKRMAKGGLAYGKSHDNGGIPLKVKSTGQNIEIEGGEGVINKRSMTMTKKVEFEGKEQTPCEVISKINQMGGGVKFNCGDAKEIVDEG